MRTQGTLALLPGCGLRAGCAHDVASSVIENGGLRQAQLINHESGQLLLRPLTTGGLCNSFVLGRMEQNQAEPALVQFPAGDRRDVFAPAPPSQWEELFNRVGSASCGSPFQLLERKSEENPLTKKC